MAFASGYDVGTYIIVNHINGNTKGSYLARRKIIP